MKIKKSKKEEKSIRSKHRYGAVNIETTARHCVWYCVVVYCERIHINLMSTKMSASNSFVEPDNGNKS